MARYAGIDRHANNRVVVWLDEQDRVVDQQRCPNALEHIYAVSPPGVGPRREPVDLIIRCGRGVVPTVFWGQGWPGARGSSFDGIPSRGRDPEG